MAIPIRFQGAGKASASTSSGAPDGNGSIDEQRSQADHAVQNGTLKTTGNSEPLAIGHIMKQIGSTLIVVLLLLVMMTLMSFALIRSSDITTLISGNIATKQAAVQAGDVGFQVAETLLLGIYSGTATPPSYYSATANPSISNKSFNAVPWSPAQPVVSGLKYQYYIEQITDSPLYRITVKVTGPRNSESYFQTLYGPGT